MQALRPKALDHLRKYPANTLDKGSLISLREELQRWLDKEFEIMWEITSSPSGKNSFREYLDSVAPDYAAALEALDGVHIALDAKEAK